MWHASGCIEYWRGLYENGGPVSQYALNWYYDSDPMGADERPPAGAGRTGRLPRHVWRRAQQRTEQRERAVQRGPGFVSPSASGQSFRVLMKYMLKFSFSTGCVSPRVPRGRGVLEQQPHATHDGGPHQPQLKARPPPHLSPCRGRFCQRPAHPSGTSNNRSRSPSPTRCSRSPRRRPIASRSRPIPGSRPGSIPRPGVVAGASAQTSLTIDKIPAGTSYFWRARAEGGGTTGPFSAARAFSIGPAIIIDSPTLVSPISNAGTNARPTFTVTNATHSGPSGALSYKFEISTNSQFAPVLITGTVNEGATRTSFTPATDLPAGDDAVLGG